jgi:subtilisin family serine protease
MKQVKRIGLGLIVLLSIFGCSYQQDSPTKPDEPSNYPTFPGQTYWNDIVQIELWDDLEADSSTELYLNGKKVTESALKYSGKGIVFELLPGSNPLPESLVVEVRRQGVKQRLKVQGKPHYGIVFKPAGMVSKGRINALLECTTSTLIKLQKRLLPSSFKLLDYFGDRRSVSNSSLGVSQHQHPWCLAVVGFKNLATEAALKQLDLLLTGLPIVALSPDFYIYSTDPRVRSFDANCSSDQLTQEAVGVTPVYQDELRSLLGVGHSTITGRGVTVAVLDGGVRQADTFLQRPGFAKLSRRFLENDYPVPSAKASDIEDDFDCKDTPYVDGHGSLVTRIIQTIAPDASVIMLKVCDKEGLCLTSSLTKALLYLRNHYQGFPHIDIVNMSFGGLIGENKVFETLLFDLMQAEPQMFFVASLGNHPDDEAHYPAQYQDYFDSIIGVAAAKALTQPGNVTWKLASFNTQVALHKNPFGFPLAAPGVAVHLDDLGNPGGISGTSFAAPMVTAVAALERQRYPAMSSSDLRLHLYEVANQELAFRMTQSYEP